MSTTVVNTQASELGILHRQTIERPSTRRWWPPTAKMPLSALLTGQFERLAMPSGGASTPSLLSGNQQPVVFREHQHALEGTPEPTSNRSAGSKSPPCSALRGCFWAASRRVQYLISLPVWRPVCLVFRLSCRHAALLLSLAERHACFVARAPCRVSWRTSRAALRCCPCSVAKDMDGSPARNIPATRPANRGLNPTIVHLPFEEARGLSAQDGGICAATLSQLGLGDRFDRVH